jgi:Raf kinase inhibitor-like YbhB/YbcL family protein
MRTISVLAALALATTAAAGGKFTLKSSDVKSGGTFTEQHIYNGFGCSGANVSPELSWANPPKDTKSYVLMVYDPDAPTGSGWWHWVVYDIPASAKDLPQGAGSGKASLPEGAVQGRTDFGAPGYGGPCPPQGHKPHRYILTVYALKTEKLDIPQDASPAMIGYMANANSLGKASFEAKYGRKK